MQTVMQTVMHALCRHVPKSGLQGGGHVKVPCTSYIIVCYAAKICGIVATLLVSTLLMGWGGVGWGGHVNVPCTSYSIVCYAAEISGIVATLLNDGEKPKNAPQIFPGVQIIKSAQHCGWKQCARRWSTVSGPAGYFCILFAITFFITSEIPT